MTSYQQYSAISFFIHFLHLVLFLHLVIVCIVAFIVIQFVLFRVRMEIIIIIIIRPLAGVTVESYLRGRCVPVSDGPSVGGTVCPTFQRLAPSSPADQPPTLYLTMSRSHLPNQQPKVS